MRFGIPPATWPVLLLATVLAGPTLAERELPDEPVPARILAPIHQLYYLPQPVATTPLGTGRWRLSFEGSESNVLHPPNDPGPKLYETAFDLEMTRLALTVEHGITERWTLAATLPFYSFHHGFLDPTIYGVEQALGKLKPRRRFEVRDQFHFRATRDGVDFFDISSGGLRPGDLTVDIRRHLWTQRGRRPELTLRGGFKVPIGDRDLGTSTGRGDLMFGAAAGWHLDRWTVNGGLALTVSEGDPRETPGLTPQPILSGYAEAAYQLGPRVSAHLQVAATSPPLRLHDETPGDLDEGETRPFTGHIVQASPTLSWRFDSGYRLYVGITEDFLSSENSASDVTLFTSLVLPLSPSGRGAV